jgi:spore photoproduct lyase
LEFLEDYDIMACVEVLESPRTITRERKSKFVRLFDKTPSEVVCPHFYELILSNGCPFDCTYCYLKLTFRGQTKPNLFCNPWEEVQKELDEISCGLFSTGELADSLAVVPPLLDPAIDYFSNQKNKYLLLLTKSTNIRLLLNKMPNRQIIVSFSINIPKGWRMYEKGTPNPLLRLKAAEQLIKRGWRVRIRLDPIVFNGIFNDYEEICKEIATVNPEMVTIGTLRQFPGLYRFSSGAPREGLIKSSDGRMRYSPEQRLYVYSKIKEWLGFQPALCKETKEIWKKLGWKFKGCNCTEE